MPNAVYQSRIAASRGVSLTHDTVQSCPTNGRNKQSENLQVQGFYSCTSWCSQCRWKRALSPPVAVANASAKEGGLALTGPGNRQAAGSIGVCIGSCGVQVVGVDVDACPAQRRTPAHRAAMSDYVQRGRRVVVGGQVRTFIRCHFRANRCCMSPECDGNELSEPCARRLLSMGIPRASAKLGNSARHVVSCTRHAQIVLFKHWRAVARRQQQ